MEEKKKTEDMSDIKYRRLKIIMLAAAAVLILMTVSVLCYTRTVRKAYTDDMLRIAGYVYEEDQETAGDLMRFLFEERGEGAIASGEKAMTDMGYTKRGLDYLYEENAVRPASEMIIAAEILLAVAGIFLIVGMKRRADGIFEMRQELESAVEKMKARERGFEEKEKMTQNFIENVAHQVKTPLSCITISLDRLREKGLAQENRTLVEQGLYYAGEIETLLRRLLDIGRLEAGRVIWHKETFRFTDMLADCAEGLTEYAQRPEYAQPPEDGQPPEYAQLTEDGLSAEEGRGGGRIVITGDQDAEYYGDYEWLKEAFSNLLKNALEHDASGGKVETEVTWSKEGVKVLIRDRGPGFAAEDIPHIFDRFYLPERIKKSHVGIGLNLANLVVRDHFGSISARNREGGGAEFHVLLPVYAMKTERI